jgi:choice-of-anchor B domain-containing protein
LLGIASVISLTILSIAQVRASALDSIHSADQLMERQALDFGAAQSLNAQAATPCTAGMAGSYPCNNIDLLAFMPLASIGGGSGNDIWGWTDPLDGKEYAIMGLTNGTTFIDISDPVNPIYLGHLATHTSNSSWRDIKVYQNHAFIVSEAGGHGMQIFDLTQLRSVASPPATFSNSAHYGAFGNAHNIVINEASGFAYAVGTSTCSGGLHMVNIQSPTSPTNAGCFSSDGYTHDAQCVIYNGPDVQHQGKEICINSNEDTITIVDVTNKAAPVQLSRTGYAGDGYTHQGWLTEDQAYFLLDDETDETSFGHNTRTRIWDVSDLDSISIIGIYDSASTAIDHNQYIKGNFSYQSNYRAGLRILDISNIAAGSLVEQGYFDIYPSSDSANFNGAWSNYPYFASGVVIVSGIEQGLFILMPDLSPAELAHVGDLDGSSVIANNGKWTASVTVTVHDAADNPISGAQVTGTWSNGASGTSVCTTDGAGSCQVSNGLIRRNINSADFSISSIVASGYSYNAGANHDPDGDSNGTAITVLKNGSSNPTATPVPSATPLPSATPAPTATPLPGQTMHVGDLDGSSFVSGSGGRWTAEVVITVHNTTGDTPLAGVLVSATWSQGANGSGSCTTDLSGQCTISRSAIKRNRSSVTLTVDSLSLGGYSYNSGANHDPDGDSTGTAIVVNKPVNR